MRNVFLAFVLTILASFSFSTTTFATTADVPAIEDGVTGVIVDVTTESGMIVIQLETSSVSLSLMNENNQRVWSTKTSSEFVYIPTTGMANGFYTLLVNINGRIEFHPISITGNASSGNTVNADNATNL